MYSEKLIRPMKQELIAVGFEELGTAEEVTAALHSKGTVLVVVNSVCGCAAGAARPGVKLSLETTKRPNRITTVFAGFDTEATAQARKYFLPFPPSSPCIGLFKDGKLVHFVERHHIEVSSIAIISENLRAAYEAYC
ncbi:MULTISPECIES: BrxA/BrxB family bacilliredoxin [unclassified Polaribacter]|uniref:BrxA/BrxB family bacilliredoxin n=1 Tax=unclassified Polaribacter TaxID=196858 RepID=UPI0011BEE73A|nr:MULTISPECIES: BrxA/BrxB family bacilliredoxin [unclassified Polaribacter]TXD50243.1 BrxA/BrxB family bacilliredoxin [Polaribacter sp. IC063]TXD56306.1 BrxA/BrxB family bacilliredoxin [Polaribacter sp. IC066]